MPDSTTPASQMIRVPTVLIDAVKELSRLHRQGHTRSIIAGLQQLIAAVDSTDVNIDSNVDISNSTTDSKHDSGLIAQLISEQLESMREQLEQDIQERVHTAIKEEVDTVLGESNA